MKALKLNQSLIAALFLAVIFLLPSCSEEKKTLADLDGTWRLDSYLINNEAVPHTIEGNWIFNVCSKKVNKNSACDGQFDYSLSYQGVTEVYDSGFVYRVEHVGGGEMDLYLDDAIYEIEELMGNSMVLVLFDSNTNETHRASFTKQ